MKILCLSKEEAWYIIRDINISSNVVLLESPYIAISELVASYLFNQGDSVVKVKALTCYEERRIKSQGLADNKEFIITDTHHYHVYQFHDLVQAIQFKLVFSESKVDIPIPANFKTFISTSHSII